MKQFIISSVIFFFFACSPLLLAQDDAFVNDFLERWENSRDYLILIAETMPEDTYDFKATP